LRGKPGDNARGSFLGGTHSVRPLSMAKRVPRDFVFTGWPGEAWSPTGICLGQAGALFAGVRSPPLRGVDHPRARWPCGASPGITREEVFSEGRTLCVRLAWPNVCRGIPLSRDGRAKPGDPWGHASIKPKFSLRACGARPSAESAIRAKMASRCKARGWR
jgi:hypothetical protein